MRTARVAGVGLAVVMMTAVGLLSQSPAGTPQPADDPMAGPSEYGLRLTPEMARGMARQFVKDELIGGLELDKSREDEFTELVARRIMSAAHAIDTDEGQATAERLAGTFLEAAGNAQRQGDHSGPKFTAETAKAFSRDMMTFMPQVRNLVRDVAQDVRPALGMQQQLKMAGELMAINTAMDAFEVTMTRWSNGQFDPGEDPFRPDSASPPLDATGTSVDLRHARERAEKDDQLKELASQWEEYVKQAKEFYGFDASQSATADSIHREIKSRGEEWVRSPEFKARRYQFILWDELTGSFGLGWGPLDYLLNQRNRHDQNAMQALDNELKQRIEKIPREEQRRSADQRVEARLAELMPESAPAPAGESANAR